MRALSRAVGCGLAVLLVLFLDSGARADVIHLRDGRRLEGEIVEETDSEVRLRQRLGVITVRRGEIVRIERQTTPEQRHAQALPGCRTADDFFALGQQAREWGLVDAARADFERAIQLDPDHEGAREALGYRRLEGRWVTEREYNEAQGLVLVDGQWVTAEEAQRIRRQHEEQQRQEAQGTHAQYAEELAGVPWVQAHRVESAHYIVISNAGTTDAVARRYADFMELLYAEYSRVFGAFPRRFSEKSTIYIIRNHREFMDMFHVPDGIGGFFRPGSFLSIPPRVVCAYHGTFGDTGSTYEVLAHEGTHQFENMVLRGANEGDEATLDFMCRPTWVLEGLAVYFGDGHRVERGRVVIGIPQERLGVLQRSIRAGDAPALHDLIRVPQPEFGGEYYAPAWGFIYYMVNRRYVTVGGRQIDLQRIFQDYFRMLTEDPQQPQAQEPEYYAGRFEQMLGVDIASLDDDWHQYILSLQLDPVGRFRGNTFTSTSLAFSVERRSRAWEQDDEGLRELEKVSFVNANTTGRVAVISTGNSGGMEARDLAEALLQRYLPQAMIDGLQVERQAAYFHHGYDGWEAVFTGRLKRAEDGLGYMRDGPQRFRAIFLTTPTRLYVVMFNSDEDRWDDNTADFDWMLETFQVLPEED